MATSTPWGTAQQSHQLAPGIMQYYTAGHGGIHLSQGRLKGLPPEFLGWDGKNGQGGWYEEDCEAAKVLLWVGIVCDHWAGPGWGTWVAPAGAGPAESSTPRLLWRTNTKTCWGPSRPPPRRTSVHKS